MTTVTVDLDLLPTPGSKLSLHVCMPTTILIHNYNMTTALVRTYTVPIKSLEYVSKLLTGTVYIYIMYYINTTTYLECN